MSTESESLSQTKIALRRWITAQIGETTEDQRAGWSQQVVDHLKNRPEWVPEGGVVAMFGGLKREVDVQPLFSWLQERHCSIAFFLMEGEVMTPWRVQHLDDLKAGVMGALEPVPAQGNRLEIGELDVVLTPGLAFDRDNAMRMGRGKGYYDRIFNSADFRGVKIGVAFALQLISGIPSEAHDRAMDHVVTENGWRSFPQG